MDPLHVLADHVGTLVVALLHTVAIFFSGLTAMIQAILLWETFERFFITELYAIVFKPFTVSLSIFLLSVTNLYIYLQINKVHQIFKVRALRGICYSKKNLGLWIGVLLIWHFLLVFTGWNLVLRLVEIKKSNIFPELLGAHNEEPYFKAMFATICALILASTCHASYLSFAFLDLMRRTNPIAYLRV